LQRTQNFPIMPRLHRLLATISTCVVWFAACDPASAEPSGNYWATQHGIDGVCNAYRPNAKPSDIFFLKRALGIDGSPGVWKRTPDDLDADLQAPDAPPGVDFVTIVTDHGSIVSANVVHAMTAAYTRETRAWCFIGGKLSRTTIETIDTRTSFGWRRTRYYDDDLTAPLVDLINEESPTVTPPKPLKDAPTATLTVEPYATPDKLPFFDAYTAMLPKSTVKKP
jgi:hypothetical protein